MNKYTVLLLASLLASALLLVSCDRSKQTAQVLSAPNATLGLVNLGVVTDFPYTGATLTMFNDNQHGNTCYLITMNNQTVFACGSSNNTLSKVQPQSTISTSPAP